MIDEETVLENHISFDNYEDQKNMNKYLERRKSMRMSKAGIFLRGKFFMVIGFLKY